MAAELGGKRNGKGSLRHNENVLRVTAVVGDYDNGAISIDEAARRLQAAHVEACVYSTGRHAEQAPRWRVVAPLRQPCSPADHAHLVGVLNGALGGVLNAESWTLSQVYVFGCVAGVEYKSVRVEGSCIDEHDAIGLIAPIGKPDTKPDAANESALGADPMRAATIARVTVETIAHLQSALAYLAEHTNRASDYKAWIDTGEALASLKGTAFEADAEELWHAFSSADAKYDADVARNKWDTLDPNKITYTSIFTWAQAARWPNPKASQVAAGDDTDGPTPATLRCFVSSSTATCATSSKPAPGFFGTARNGPST